MHILDQLSRNLPDFLWLEKMNANNNQITITGKATTYNAVTNFYNNLSRSGFFQDVTLGRTFEVHPKVFRSALTAVLRRREGDERTRPI